MKLLQNVAAASVLLVVCSALALSVPAAADETPGASTNPAAKKLERGLHNGVTGWLEAPVTVQKFHEERGLFDALTTGVARGVGLAIARTGAGIYETATFPFAAPENYEPVIMPERVDG